MFIKNILKIFLVFFRKSSNACVLMHDKFKLYRARSGYIRAITITFTLIVILFLCGAVRFNLSAWRRSPPRPHSRTCSSPYSIRAVSLPHTSRSPQCCLNDSCDLLFMVVFGLISSAFTPTPHRVPIRTGYTEFVLSQHKAHFIARAVKRCRFIHIPLEQTYSIPHFRFSQTRHKLVTSDLQSHVQKRIQPAICTNVVLFIQYERMHNPPAYID